MKDRPQFVAYITKYALTTGIERRLVEDCSDTAEGLVAPVGASYRTVYHSREWVRTEAEAVARFSEMKAARLVSLEKSAQKLRRMFPKIVGETP